MGVYWLGVVIDKLPDSFEDGVAVSDGFNGEPSNDTSQFQYAILARASAPSSTEAEQLARNATEQYSPSAVVIVADAPEQVIRDERRLAASLQFGDVSLKNSFVGFKRNSREAQEHAVGIIRLAITKKWWQFWR